MLESRSGRAVRPALKSVRLVFMLAVASFCSTSTVFATPWRTAADGVSAPVVASETVENGTIVLTCRFPEPRLSVAADGLADIRIDGVDNSGAVGAPLLPFQPMRVAVPQGRTVAEVTVDAVFVPVADGVVLRHAVRQFSPKSCSAAATPSDVTIYSSDDEYPKSAVGERSARWKQGVEICEFNVYPVRYVPAAGKVLFAKEMKVEVKFLSTRTRSARSPSSTMSASAASAIRATAALVDNPVALDGYTAATVRRAASAPLLDLEDGELPCSNSQSFRHVVITANELTNAVRRLVSYRRGQGIASTMVTVEDIVASYRHGGDTQTAIRDFIRDAWRNWGAEYVVLAGDDSLIPARKLYAENGGVGEEIPSDLYYQCLDGTFDYDEDGIYGEPGDGPNGGEVDLYAEVEVGRVPAETDSEFGQWLAKLKKYEADCAAGAAYTRGAFFAAEHLGPYANSFGKPLMEQIRLGTEYEGDDDGFTAKGFMDAPDFFDADRMGTLYDADRATDGAGNWSGGAAALALSEGGYSAVNHVGHGGTDSLMRLGLDEIDALDTPPLFIYSSACDSGAFDLECAAERIIVASGGAFAGVFNTRDGFYAPGTGGVMPSGASHRYQRRFWNAVFTATDENRTIGRANSQSHERNASIIDDEGMRWCYYTTTLFGDPITVIGGYPVALSLDREAYRTDATAVISYKTSDFGEADTNGAFTAIATLLADDVERTEPVPVLLLPARVDGSATNYVGLLDLSAIAATDGDILRVVISNREEVAASAVIDGVAPVFRNVSLASPDEDVLAVSWETFNPATGAAEAAAGAVIFDGVAPFASPTTIAQPDYSASHSVKVEDLDGRLYYVRIVAFDMAGNTNVWNSPSVTEEVVSPNVADYGRVSIPKRETRASFDMEKDASSWTVTGYAGREPCWQLGTPKYGPLNASRCWGTVLDGRYPDGANDCLVSPAITLRRSPVVTFRHWYSIQTTPNGGSYVADADYGIVEIIAVGSDGSYTNTIDGAWMNVLPFASRSFDRDLVRGTSGGWETVRLALPDTFAGKTVRVRFRFVSDTYPGNQYPDGFPEEYVGNPAGWYIDTVRFLDLPDDNVTLTIASIDDGDGGNGDGMLQPGETARVWLTSSNNGDEDILVPDGGCTVTVAATGASAGKVTVNGGESASAIVRYGTLPANDSVNAAGPIEISLDASIPPNTAITLTQTLIDSNGNSHRSVATFRSAPTGSVLGRVVQPPYDGLPDPNPVKGAKVRINSSDGDYVQTTDDDGKFTFSGLAAGRVMDIEASYGDAAARRTVVAPADGVEMTIPLAEIRLGQNLYIFTVTNLLDDIVIDGCTISNIFVEALADGNQGPSCNLEYTVSGHLDSSGNPVAGLAIANPSGSIAPGEGVDLGITLRPSEMDASSPYLYRRLFITSNAWNARTATILFVLELNLPFDLMEAGFTCTDRREGSEYIDEYFEMAESNTPPEDFERLAVTNDFDGYLDVGELVAFRFGLRNNSQVDTVWLDGQVVDITLTNRNDETAEVGSVTLARHNGSVWWGVYQDGIAPRTTEYTQDVTFLWAAEDGAEVTFHIHALAYDIYQLIDGVPVGAPVSEHDFYYTIVAQGRNSMEAQVVSVNLEPASPAGATNNVPKVAITLENHLGEILVGGYTDNDGKATVNGLVPGEKYWVSYKVPLGSDAIMPFAYCYEATTNSISTNVVGTTYGKASCHIALDSLTIEDADGDGCIDNGELLTIRPVLRNDSDSPASMLSGRLTLPESYETNSCMEIVDGEIAASGWCDVIAAQGTGTFAGAFTVMVSTNAVEGEYQRFYLEVWDAADEVAAAADGETVFSRHWYFDFKVKVGPRYVISGSATNALGAAVPGAKITLERSDGAYSAVAVPAATDGAYSFGGLEPGEYTVSLVDIPVGYGCQTNVLDFVVTDADVTNAVFLIEDWWVKPETVTGASYTIPAQGDPNGSFSAEVDEGQSGTATFTVMNSAPDYDSELEISIGYRRRKHEVQSAEEVRARQVSLSESRAARRAVLGDDWTKLDPGVYSRTEYEFVFTEESTIAERDAWLARHGLVATYHFRTFPAAIAIPGSGASARLAADSLARAGSFTMPEDDGGIVVSAQPAVLGFKNDGFVPDDALFAEQWALLNERQTGGTSGYDIGATAAWEYARGKNTEPVIVAVTDSGISYTHPDLSGAMNQNYTGWNYVFDSNSIGDQTGHGTHVAGIIGAVANNSIGVAGVAPTARLISQRISALDDMGEEIFATSAQIARSYEEAYLAGAKVNNNSLSLTGAIYGPSEILYNAISKARDYNMLFVCSAGNDASSLDRIDTYPAAYAENLDNIIVVASTDHDGAISSFSNYSPKKVHLAAPGSDIVSTVLNGQYGYMSGTSMSAAYVSGAAAFLWSMAPDADYRYIRDVLLGGVRVDDQLAEYVSTSGHLDLYTSALIMGANWIRFDAEEVVLTTNITLAAGRESAEFTLLLNDPPSLGAGEYEAVISLRDAGGMRQIPFTLTVNPGTVAKLGDVEVTAEENPDGLYAHDEEATLSITVRNAGSAEFESLSATLEAFGGEVLTGAKNYGYVLGRADSRPGAFRVRFPSSGDVARYTLHVTNDGESVGDFDFEIPLFVGKTLVVAVTNADGVAVAGAEVELFGAAGSRNVTDADGMALLVMGGDASGDCTLRVISPDYVIAEQHVSADAGTVSVTLAPATLEPASSRVEVTIAEGVAFTTNIAFTVAGADLSAALSLHGRARVAIFDDGDSSAFLASRLSELGVDVDYYPSNYIFTAYNYAPVEYAKIVQAVRYTWDDAALLPYDAVIAILSGKNGAGRLLIDSERDAYATYIARGGRAVFSGTTPLARPDNEDLAAMLGLTVGACDIAEADRASATASADGLGAPFITLASGGRFAAEAGQYDSSTNSTFVSGECLATMDGSAPVAKIYASARSDLGGQAVIWNGNASDWLHDGAALDILRGYLYDECVASNAVAWANIDAMTLDVADGATGEVAVAVNEARTLGVGTYEATVLARSAVNGATFVPMTLSVTVEPPTIRVHNRTGSVTDFGGRPLRGDGGVESCVLQLICAGENGVIDPPDDIGGATGDDTILAASGTALPYATFGSGTAIDPDYGRFDVLFNLDVGGESPALYVRAWSGPNPATSAAYGDSGVSNVTFSSGLPDPIDFGSWSLSNVVASCLMDSNGDSIPDSWYMTYRPDLDPNAPIAPLGNAISNTVDDYIQCATPPPNNANAEGNPARVFVTNNLVFVLEQYKHRVAVYDFVGRTNLLYFGATAQDGAGHIYREETAYAQSTNAVGGFTKPFGMALDTFTDPTRFAVADTGNGRIQLFSFDPESGEIEFVSAYGAETASDQAGTSAPEGTFREPQAVAFMPGGYILVADTGNYRVVRLHYDPETGAWAWDRAFQFTADSTLTGVCYDKDTTGGFWVADAGKGKQRVSFHRFTSFSSDPVASFGAYQSNDLTTPRDVQIWRIGGRKRIAAVDYQGSRVRILDALANDRGAYTGVVARIDVGSASDRTLEDFQKLYLPNGVFPVAGTNLIFVADYGKRDGGCKIKWYSLTLDIDQDGIDDFWEDMNGLDSAEGSDALVDSDGDGLLNIGEFRSGCDPQAFDTDGDGHGDLYEMFQMADPLDPDSFPEKEDGDVKDGAEILSILAYPDLVGQGLDTNVVVTIVLDREVPGPGRFTMYDGEGYGRTVGYLEYSAVVASNVLDNAADPTGLVTVVTATIRTPSYPVGVVNGAFVLADSDPPATNGVALFEVVPTATAVSITAEKASGSTSSRIVEGDDVTIVATFDIEPYRGVATLVNEAGTTVITNAAMALSGTALTSEYTTTSNDIGWASASFGFDAAIPVTTNCVDLFRVWPRTRLVSVATYDASGVVTNAFVAGDEVTIVATFDNLPEEGPYEGSVALVNAAGTEVTNAVMAASGNALSFTYATTRADVGWASGLFSFIDSDTAATNIVDLFEVLEPPTFFRVTSATFYDANGNPTNIFTKGDPIRLDVHFDTNDHILNIGLFYLKGVGGDWTSSVSMTLDDGVATHTTYDIDYYTGVLAVRLSVSGAEIHLETNIVETITIVDPGTPPQPTEEYEEVPWSFSSITVTNSVATLAWAMPTAKLPSGEQALLFRIGYRASLTAGAWDWTVVPANDVSVAQGSGSKTVNIDISAAPFNGATSAFFKLLWLNKVKE